MAPRHVPRLRRLLAGAVLTAAVISAVPSVPAAADDSEQSTADFSTQAVLTAGNFRYSYSATSASLISALDAALPNPTVANVLDSANRTATACSAPASYRLASFCWQSDDGSTGDWMPQGITTSADAYAAGTYGGDQVLLASWYSTGTGTADKGVRVSFVDLASRTTPKYRHVLLVEPVTVNGQASFREVRVHAGGMAWYGNLLYVVDTYNGFRIFDMDHLWTVSDGDPDKIGRQSDGTYHARNYSYALPQVAKYTDSAVTYEQIRHSAVSLDRTSSPDSLIVGEYANPGTGSRIIRIPIDYTNRLLVTGSDGYARANEAHVVNFTSMQGATAINGTMYASTSDGSGAEGDVIKWRPPSGTVYVRDDTQPIGPEDFSYWGPRDELWSLSEYAGKRYVYAMDASSF